MEEPGIDYIGIGVGAIIFNDQDQFLIGLRGKAARNERGKWEIPGGKLEFGETLADCLKREIKEEVDIEIEVVELFHVCDHLIQAEKQHWVSPTYICRLIKGNPRICEPDKCQELRWVSLEETTNLPISIVTQNDIDEMRRRRELGRPYRLSDFSVDAPELK